MIRGALILGVGFALGYAKAMDEASDIRDFVAHLWEDLKSAEQPQQTTPDSAVIADEEIVAPIPDNTTEGESHD